MDDLHQRLINTKQIYILDPTGQKYLVTAANLDPRQTLDTRPAPALTPPPPPATIAAGAPFLMAAILPAVVAADFPAGTPVFTACLVSLDNPHNHQLNNQW